MPNRSETLKLSFDKFGNYSVWVKAEGNNLPLVFEIFELLNGSNLMLKEEAFPVRNREDEPIVPWTTWSHVDIYANDQDLVINDLAHALFRGELALFLGSGVSGDFGLPGWLTLVQRCCSKLGLDSTKVTNNPTFDALTAAAEKIRNQCKDV